MTARRRALSTARKAAGHTQESLAELLGVDRSTVIRWERGGDSEPQPCHRGRLAAALGLSRDELAALLETPAVPAMPPASWYPTSSYNGEQEALELARRVAASEVSAETLGRPEDVVDVLAMAYPVTPPANLLDPVRRHLAYVMHLPTAPPLSRDRRPGLSAPARTVVLTRHRQRKAWS